MQRRQNSPLKVQGRSLNVIFMRKELTWESTPKLTRFWSQLFEQEHFAPGDQNASKYFYKARVRNPVVRHTRTDTRCLLPPFQQAGFQ